MAQKAQHPQRINERLFSYWESQKQGRAFPSESDINPDDLGDVWEHSFLINVRSPEAFKYAYMGQALVDAFGDDVTNDDVCSQLLVPDKPLLVEKLQAVLRNTAPVIDEGEFVNPRGQRICYRICLLPLGKMPDRISYILGGMKWKAY